MTLTCRVCGVCGVWRGQFACDFIIYNSKSARSRLARNILGVHRTALELLPHYARLAAIMERALPGFVTPIINKLAVRGRVSMVAVVVVGGLGWKCALTRRWLGCVAGCSRRTFAVCSSTTRTATWKPRTRLCASSAS